MKQPARADVRALVYTEARLRDERKLDDWYDLYTDDALYWMPLKHGQREDEVYNALFYEDKLMLKVRIERLKRAEAPSQLPPSRCQHVLQRPEVEIFDPDAGRFATRTPFVYVESQLDEQFVLAGAACHELVTAAGALRIRRKRIELLNREAALPSIQLFP